MNSNERCLQPEEREQIALRHKLLTIAGEAWEAFAVGTDWHYPEYVAYRVDRAIVWEKVKLS